MCWPLFQSTINTNRQVSKTRHVIQLLLSLITLVIKVVTVCKQIIGIDITLPDPSPPRL